MSDPDTSPEPQYRRKGATSMTNLTDDTEVIDTEGMSIAERKRAEQLLIEAREVQIADLEEQLEAAQLREQELAEQLANANQHNAELQQENAFLQQEITTPAKAPNDAHVPNVPELYKQVFAYLDVAYVSPAELVDSLQKKGPIELAGWIATLDAVRNKVEGDAEALRKLAQRAGTARQLLD